MAKVYRKSNGAAVAVTGAGTVPVVNSLSSTATNKALSAGQGKILKDTLDTKANKSEIPTSLPANGGNADWASKVGYYQSTQPSGVPVGTVWIG